MKKIIIPKNIFSGIKKLSVEDKRKIVLLVLFAGILVWFASDYISAKKEVALLSNPQAQQEVYQKEIKDVVKQVSKLIILPAGEPNMATIKDAVALAKQQPFFKDAKNGDKILIYKNKAIIFRPTQNILVNVGPVYAQDGGGGRQGNEVPVPGSSLKTELKQ